MAGPPLLEPTFSVLQVWPSKTCEDRGLETRLPARPSRALLHGPWGHPVYMARLGPPHQEGF